MIQRIKELDHAPVTLEIENGGDAMVYPAEPEIRLPARVDILANRDDGGTHSRPRRALSHIGTVDVELVRWDEGVKLRIPLRAGIGFIG